MPYFACKPTTYKVVSCPTTLSYFNMQRTDIVMYQPREHTAGWCPGYQRRPCCKGSRRPPRWSAGAGSRRKFCKFYNLRAVFVDVLLTLVCTWGRHSQYQDQVVLKVPPWPGPEEPTYCVNSKVNIKATPFHILKWHPIPRAFNLTRKILLTSFLRTDQDSGTRDETKWAWWKASLARPEIRAKAKITTYSPTSWYFNKARWIAYSTSSSSSSPHSVQFHSGIVTVDYRR